TATPPPSARFPLGQLTCSVAEPSALIDFVSVRNCHPLTPLGPVCPAGPRGPASPFSPFGPTGPASPTDDGNFPSAPSGRSVPGRGCFESFTPPSAAA